MCHRICKSRIGLFGHKRVHKTKYQRNEKFFYYFFLYTLYIYMNRKLIRTLSLKSSSSSWMYVYLCVYACWQFGSAEHHLPSTTFLLVLFPRVYAGHEVRGWNHRWCCKSQLWDSLVQASFCFGQSDRQILYQIPPTKHLWNFRLELSLPLWLMESNNGFTHYSGWSQTTFMRENPTDGLYSTVVSAMYLVSGVKPRE